MGIMMLLLGGLIGSLVLINRLTINKNNLPEESILDQSSHAMDEQTYNSAKAKPVALIRIGILIIGLDTLLILCYFVYIFDLDLDGEYDYKYETFWENCFAFVAMLIVPISALFLIVRGTVKLNQLKKQFETQESTNY